MSNFIGKLCILYHDIQVCIVFADIQLTGKNWDLLVYPVTTGTLCCLVTTVCTSKTMPEGGTGVLAILSVTHVLIYSCFSSFKARRSGR